MSKFKVRLKIQGFELEIDGSREDIPAIGQNLGDQLSGLISPSLGIVEGEGNEKIIEGHAQSISQANSPDIKRKPRKKRNSNANASPEDAVPEALDWQHDAQKFGMPKQQWNTATKALWILFVVKEVLQKQSVTAKQISETFNKHFRQAGQIQTFNVTRDLGKLKVKASPPPVGENTSRNPSEWYLTDEGVRQVKETIVKQRET